MIPFYTELKNLRNQQEIDLSEISSRTKIDIHYLEAIESGDFSFLPGVYVRLFLRAYALEIGADPLDTLKQFDIHIAKTEEIPQPQKIVIEETDKNEEEEENHDVPRKTPFKIRSDLYKVVALLVIVIFAIFIIRKIISEESMESQNAMAEELPPSTEITDEWLALNYISHSRTENLSMEAPYYFTLRALAPIWCEYSIDDFQPLLKTLVSGEKDSVGFEFNFHLRIDNSSRVELIINNFRVSIDSLPNPVDLTYQSESSELTIINYSLQDKYPR